MLKSMLIWTDTLKQSEIVEMRATNFLKADISCENDSKYISKNTTLEIKNFMQLLWYSIIKDFCENPQISLTINLQFYN